MKVSFEPSEEPRRTRLEDHPAGSTNRLLENIWLQLRETFRTRKAHGRRQMLMEMQKVVAFQPAAVHGLVQLAMITRRRRAMTMDSRLLTRR